MIPQESPRAVSQHAYRTMFARAPDMCVALRFGSGTIMQCNERVRTTLGYAPEEVVGRSIVALACPDASASTRESLRQLARGPDLRASHLPMRGKDGSRVDVCVTAAGVRDDDGRISFGLAVLRARHAPVEATPADNPARLRALLYALSMAEERERRRIAAGLHDELGQLLAIAKLKLGQLGEAREPAERERLAAELSAVIDQASRATRATTFELSSPVLQQFGLEAAIRSLGERMQSLYGIEFRMKADTAGFALPEATQVVVLRVIRELLFNVHKHARARQVIAILRRTETDHVFEVRDDGVGLLARATRGLTPAGGFGLFSVQAQVESVGGRFAIGPGAGGGTRAVLSIPRHRRPGS